MDSHDTEFMLLKAMEEDEDIAAQDDLYTMQIDLFGRREPATFGAAEWPVDLAIVGACKRSASEVDGNGMN